MAAYCVPVARLVCMSWVHLRKQLALSLRPWESIYQHMVPRTKDNNIKELPFPLLCPRIHGIDTLARWPEVCPGTFKNSSDPPFCLRRWYQTLESFNFTDKQLQCTEFRSHVYSKHCYLPTRLHGVTSHKLVDLVVIYPDDGGSTFVWNIANHSSDYTS
jgi:hypothetical protein